MSSKNLLFYVHIFLIFSTGLARKKFQSLLRQLKKYFDSEHIILNSTIVIFTIFHSLILQWFYGLIFIDFVIQWTVRYNSSRLFKIKQCTYLIILYMKHSFFFIALSILLTYFLSYRSIRPHGN